MHPINEIGLEFSNPPGTPIGSIERLQEWMGHPVEATKIS
jgi:hypothetical protein